MSDERAIAAEILRQLAQRAPASSICPSEVARALAPGDEAGWRALMPQVRETAARLRASAQVRITRGGEDVAADSLHHGAIRLARGAAFDGQGPAGTRCGR